jgi:hypothetical protein
MTDFRALCEELFVKLKEWDSSDPYHDCGPLLCRARAALAQPDQDDKTLNAIRETTPRYRMSVIVSTTDSAIDTRMNVIWQALDLSKEILESVSLPEQLPPLGSQ